MIKARHRLCKSCQWWLGCAVAALGAWQAASVVRADGDQSIVTFHHPASVPAVTVGGGHGLHHDTSCEPTFRGGNCEDCCLHLWQDYCAERSCSHTRSKRFCLLGCLGPTCLGFGSFARCLDESSVHSSDYAYDTSAIPAPSNDASESSLPSGYAPKPVVELPLLRRPARTDTVPTEVPFEPSRADSTRHDSDEGNLYPQRESTHDDAQQVAPPANPAPLPPEPASETQGSSDAGSLEIPPVPFPINFSVEPSGSKSLHVDTVSTQRAAGMNRLLRQLRSK